MTTEALDLLDRLSVGAIKEAAQYKDRPQDRFGATHFRADILGSGADLQVTTRRPLNSNFDQTGVWLTIDVKEILAGKGELGEQQLWIRMPGARRDGSPTQAEDNSEYSRMLLAANESDPSITSLRQLPGRKNVEFKDDVHKYSGRSRNDSTGEWYDREFTTWFYRLNFRPGGAVATSNGAAPVAKPSDAAINRALEMIKAAGDDGIKESEFNLAITKGQNALPIKYVSEGTFVADHSAQVLRDGNMLVWVGGDE